MKSYLGYLIGIDHHRPHNKRNRLGTKNGSTTRIL